MCWTSSTVNTDVEQLRFGASGGIPNNSRLPAIVQHGVEAIVGNPDACEELFAANGWAGSWRDGIFAFHHFHSNAHEALGVVSGEATVLLGGPDGQEVRLVSGDVVVLPAGTGHKRQAASADLLVIGAYPRGQERYDLHRGDPAELEAVRRNVARVPLPESDPVGGRTGPVLDAWS